MNPRKRTHSVLEEDDRSPPGASSLPSGQTRHTQHTRHDPSASEVRRDSRRESDTLGRNKGDDEHRSAPRNITSTLGRDAATNDRRPQSTAPVQQTRQSSSALQPGETSKPPTLDEKLKNSEDFINGRDLIERALHQLELINPRGPHYQYDTERAEVNDIITLPHVEFRRNKTPISGEEHTWLPAPSGHLLIKYRRGVVIEKYQGGLKQGTFTTFSNTPMYKKRKQRVFDEVQNKKVISLNDYVHIVATDNPDKSEHYPECLLDGVAIRYRAARGCHPGLAKDSFMNPHIPYLMSNETPFLIVGQLEDEENEARLDTAVNKAAKRTETARAKASAAKHEKKRKAKARAERSHAYDGNSASPHMPPPPKKLKPDHPTRYRDLDAPEPPSLMVPDGYSLPYDTTSGGMSSNSKIPNTALRGLNVTSTVDGRPVMSYDGLGTAQGIPKF